MRLLVVLTYIAVAALVVALAAYLLVVIWLLRSIKHTAGRILIGARVIAERAAPIAGDLDRLNAELTRARDALAPLVERGRARERQTAGATAGARDQAEATPPAQPQPSGVRSVSRTIVEQPGGREQEAGGA